MATCERCQQADATFNSPKNLCNGCWFDWFTKRWTWETPEERDTTRQAFVTNGEIPNWP